MTKKTENTNMDLLGSSAPAAGTKAPAQAPASQAGFVLDLSGVEGTLEADFPLKPEGIHTVEVVKIEFGESKSSGVPMITFEFGYTGDEKGKIWDYCVLGGAGQEFGVKRLKKYLDILAPGTPLSTFSPAVFAADLNFIGKVLDITIKHKKQTKGDNKGKMRETIVEATVAGMSTGAMSNGLL
jgi:hypothetical protein